MEAIRTNITNWPLRLVAKVFREVWSHNLGEDLLTQLAHERIADTVVHIEAGEKTEREMREKAISALYQLLDILAERLNDRSVRGVHRLLLAEIIDWSSNVYVYHRQKWPIDTAIPKELVQFMASRVEVIEDSSTPSSSITPERESFGQLLDYSSISENETTLIPSPEVVNIDSSPDIITIGNAESQKGDAHLMENSPELVNILTTTPKSDLHLRENTQERVGREDLRSDPHFTKVTHTFSKTAEGANDPVGERWDNLTEEEKEENRKRCKRFLENPLPLTDSEDEQPQIAVMPPLIRLTEETYPSYPRYIEHLSAPTNLRLRTYILNLQENLTTKWHTARDYWELKLIVEGTLVETHEIFTEVKKSMQAYSRRHSWGKARENKKRREYNAVFLTLSDELKIAQTRILELGSCRERFSRSYLQNVYRRLSTQVARVSALLA